MNDLKQLITGKKDGDIKPSTADDDDDGVPWPQTADAYELKSQIGQGAFAKVYQAYCKEKDTDIAIKVMELDNLTSSLEDIYQEVRVMLLSKNPSVLKAYACFVVNRSLWLVMPLMRKGSCLRIMKVLKRMGLPDGMKEDWIATILKSTLIGLEYFHQQGQLHRDIKASNLLMGSDGSVRISDFGVAGWLPSGNLDRGEGARRTFVGTPCWMAPEVMEQADAYDEKADIWSFGITALELAKGYAPYARMPPMKVLLMTIQNPPPSLKTYDDFSKTKNKFSRHFKDVIGLCLQRDPRNRPSATTLLTKTFFKRAPPASFLVKDLLEAHKIPDTNESRNKKGELDNVIQDQMYENERRKEKEEAKEIAESSGGEQASSATATESAPAPSDVSDGGTAPAAGDAANTGEGAPPGEPADAEKASTIMDKLDKFQPGSTWDFGDEGNESAPAPDSAQPPNAANSEADNTGSTDFEAFEKQFANAGIKGETGN